MKKFLLDTHVLLWAIGESNQLSPQVEECISDRTSEVYVSAISLWEIAIKHSVGKLELNFEIEDIPKYCDQMDFCLIPLKPMDAFGFYKLPLKNNHKDPFDRMLVYQCIRGNYTLVSRDDKMKLYESDGLKCIW